MHYEIDYKNPGPDPTEFGVVVGILLLVLLVVVAIYA